MIDGLPKPDWQRGDVSLYCGDCLEILPKLLWRPARRCYLRGSYQQAAM